MNEGKLKSKMTDRQDDNCRDHLENDPAQSFAKNNVGPFNRCGKKALQVQGSA